MPNDVNIGQPTPSDIHTPSAYASIIAANTTTILYQISPGCTARIKKIVVTNRTGGGGFLRIGIGAFTQVFPDLLIPNALTTVYNEQDLPEYWFREFGSATTDIVAQASVGAASPTDVQVFVEVEEKGLG